MDTGNPSTPNILPTFDSGFPIDFAIMRRPASSEDWYTTYRLVQKGYININGSTSENSYQGFQCDSNLGWARDGSYNQNYQSWMWKRHAGFDVVTYKGNSNSNRQIPHNLGRAPEMMWLKARDSNSAKWNVYHSGANGGVTPENWYILFTSGVPGEYGPIWADTAPTATSFTVGSYGEVNSASYNYVMMLFASVTGLCKVGWYTGDGTDNGTHAITVGFQPRFLIMKCVSDAVDWQVLDTTRGWGSGDDKYMELNTTAAQYTTTDFGAPTSTGFTLAENAGFNGSGRRYIYYAHA